MTRAGLVSARLSSGQLADIVDLVDDAQWELPSACAGWRVIDVLAHLGALAHEAVEPPAPEPGLPTDRERYHDLRVDERRGWTHAEVLHEWRVFTPAQLEILEAAQEPPRAADPVEVPGLGTYPRHLLANTMAFNVLCHLRRDLLAPDGPLPFTVPEENDALVAPAVEFMLAGLPQMQGPELTATVTEPLVLELTGPGATTVTVLPAARQDGPRQDGPEQDVGQVGPRQEGRRDGTLTVRPGAEGATRIVSTASDFIAWGTTRKPWRDLCRVVGDPSAATPFLDRLDII
ncbi:maleylpyruvate isomerase N-terminal domain-containing protein [Streptomyces sp. NPDC001185]|uniref:maleylpyruvate isomerase N-terminal domain-containing protein n=1 Tax=Streptomyces sp. NPDC001185 TaxID=3154380 RepID=UPI00332A2544